MKRDPVSDRPDTLIAQALQHLTRSVVNRPWRVLVLAMVLAGGAVAVTVEWLEFQTERSDLIDPEADFHRRWLEYARKFPDTSDLVVVVQGEDPGRVREALERLGQRVESRGELFRNVLYRIDLPVPPEVLAGSADRSTDPVGDLVARLKPLDGVFQGSTRFARPDLIAVSRSERLADGDPDAVAAVGRFSDSLDGFLDDPSRFRDPWFAAPATSGGGVYLLNDDGTTGYLRVAPIHRGGGFEGAEESIGTLRSIIGGVLAEDPGVEIGLTGVPVLESDEMQRSRHDMLVAAAISSVGVLLLMLVGFRCGRHPLAILVVLASALAWSFGFTTVVIGHLNILSVAFAVVLIGLGVDFAIHYLSRYVQLRQHGCELQPALGATAADVGPGILTAALTTALAFCCAGLTEFRGVAELGWIAGAGILLCALATFTLAPAVVRLVDARIDPVAFAVPLFGERFRHLVAEHPRTALVASLLTAGLAAVTLIEPTGEGPALRVRVDNNLLNLQADGLESVDWQRRVARESHGALLFAVSLAGSRDEAERLARRFEQLPSVRRAVHLGRWLPVLSASRSESLRRLAAAVTRTRANPPAPQQVTPAEFVAAVDRLRARVTGIPGGRAERATEQLAAFLDRFGRLTESRRAAFIERYQLHLIGAVLDRFGQLAALADLGERDPTDLPPELVSRFVSPDGDWLVQVFPRSSIWEPEPLAEFVDDVRRVDPRVTGTPLQNHEAGRQIGESYRQAALLALAIIVVVLLAGGLPGWRSPAVLLLPLLVVAFTLVSSTRRSFEVSPAFLAVTYAAVAAAISLVLDWRCLRDAALALLPPLLGGFLMLAVMVLGDVPLNPANLIVLPLVLGIGVDDGVHVVHDYRTQSGAYVMSPSTIHAVLLTSLTSMIGFGSLLVAAHRGLFSLGLVLVIGVGCCLLVALVPLPAILRLMSSAPGRGTPAQGQRSEESRS